MEWLPALFLLFELASGLVGNLSPCPLAGILDPEVCMSVPEMIRQYGYPAESHDVYTSDNYILQVHRIPHGKGSNNCGTRPAVLMQHGLLGASADWVINKPDQSPGFLLADAGFDVWLGNIRGNPYGMRHRTLSSTQPAFWDFSWDEMVEYDLPAMVDFILTETNQSSLYYFGHSQGTLIMFAKLAKDSSFSGKIRHFYALAPIGAVKNIKGALRAVKAIEPAGQFLYDNLGSFGVPSDAPSRLFGGTTCSISLTQPLCEAAVSAILGPSQPENYNLTRVGVYFAHYASGTSMKNTQHWSQSVKRGRVHAFDYGSEAANNQKYGQPTPPAYDYSKISSVPISLFWSEEDWLADPIDLREFLFPSLQPSVVKANISVPGYAHADFLYGLKAKNDVFRPILVSMTDSVTKCPKA